jgi:hypothetical protein
LAVNNAQSTPVKTIGIPPVAIVIFLMLIAGGAGFYYLNRAASQPPAPPPPLSTEAKVYVREGHLAISNVEKEANVSYLNQQVLEITGSIANTGDRKVGLVEINCIFRDPYNQVVLRERVPIVTRQMGGLAPGEQKSFRLPFDSVPDGWNQALPDMVIARIDFQ